MATRLYGTLRDGLGKPIINATVALLAKGNTITVLTGSEAIFKTDSQGAYNITVQTGYYKVIIGPQGIEPYKAGEIAIYADSKEGSLNSYLTSWAPEELTPEVIAQVKELVANSEQFALQAGRSAAAAQADATDARNSKASAAQSASDALVYKNDSKTNADAAKQAQAGAAGSANTASAALTTIQGIQKDVTASKDRAVTAETNAKSSETVATQAKTDAVTAKDQAIAAKDKAQQIANSIDPQSIKNSIGLGVERRYLSDLTKPFSDVGFFMINSSTIGYPSIADQSAMSGYVARQDGSPSYTGLFVDPGHGHAYTMTQFNNTATFRQLTFASDVDRFKQQSSGTRIYGGPQDERYFEVHTGAWGVYNVTEKKWIPLSVSQGGTGAVTVPDAKVNLQIPFTGITRWTDYTAPAGAEAGKYYPVIISHPSHYNGDFLVEVAMRTKSITGSESPNCNAIHLWIRDGGWSDMGAAAFGHYFCYARDENAILCVRGTDKGQYPHNAIYVRGDAFPIRLAATVGCTVTIPTADWKPSTASESPTYKWGITNSSDGIDLNTYGISNNLLDFTASATGFYCTDTYRNKYGDAYQVIASNGTIQPANGVATYIDQDWNAQHTDTISKFKPIAGKINSPESNIVYSGFHVGFSGSYATQFAGRNSNFWLRSIEAGITGEWLKLITATLAPKIPTDARDGFISDSTGDPSWAPSNGGGFQASYAENRIMQGWIDAAGRLYSRFLTTNRPTTSKTDVPWKSAAMLELDNRFTGTNAFLGDIICSAANPLTLKSGNPTLSFVESDAQDSTYMFVADGGGFRLNRDTTAGAEIFHYSRAQNNLKLGVSSYFTLNTRFDQGLTSRGSVDVTTAAYSGIAITTTASTDSVGARNLFEVSPDNSFYLARRNRSNNTGQWIINFPTAGGTLALSGTSDINYKTNIEDYDGLHSVENIKAMELVTFVFKDDERKRVRRGVIAQQIEQIDPTYVKRTYEPCGEAIVDENGIVQGYSEEKERVVLDNNVILLDCLCALQVLIKRDEEKTQELDKLKQEVLELKNTVKDLVNAINGNSNNTQLP